MLGTDPGFQYYSYQDILIASIYMYRNHHIKIQFQTHKFWEKHSNVCKKVTVNRMYKFNIKHYLLIVRISKRFRKDYIIYIINFFI